MHNLKFGDVVEWGEVARWMIVAKVSSKHRNTYVATWVGFGIPDPERDLGEVMEITNVTEDYRINDD